MQANYDRIIEYSLFPRVRELHLETLPMSDAGAQHFAEAKDIFQLFVQRTARLGGGCGARQLAVAPASVDRLPHRWRDHRAGHAVDAGGPTGDRFRPAFVVFHEIAFDNELWIFDPRTDPIIDYLPEALFMRNAFAILAVMIVLSVAAILLDAVPRPPR